jgi:20S proteasome alpha/beta subunit
VPKCDAWFGEEEPLSLCIAATCRGEDEKSRAVFCCDTAGTRGDIKSEDILKIKDVGNSVALLAGDNSQARELLQACKPFVEAFPFRGNDVQFDALKKGLSEAVRLRKRQIATAILSAELGVTYDEVFNFSQSHPDDPLWRDAWKRIRGLDLGAAIAISTFTDDELAILTIDVDGKVQWADHYAAVGTGSHIASAFLQQLPYRDSMEVSECLYRVMEAKIAAEAKPYVGKQTILEVRGAYTSGILTNTYELNLRALVDQRRKLPSIPSVDYHRTYQIREVGPEDNKAVLY